jgi:hypothetical protein
MIKYRYCGAGDEAVEQLVKSDSILKKHDSGCNNTLSDWLVRTQYAH